MDCSGRASWGVLLVCLAPARHCWPRLWPGEGGGALLLHLRISLSRCSSAWVQRACATCSSRPAGRRRHHLHRRARCAGPARAASATPSAVNDEREQTLNQLLTEMDGFDSSVGLIIRRHQPPRNPRPGAAAPVASTNQVLVDRPDKKGRLDILKVHVKKVTLAQDIDLEQVAALTTGFSGTDLANLVNKTALAAAGARPAVELRDFRRHRAHRGEPGEERTSAQSQGRNRGLSRDGPCAGGAGALASTDPVLKISIIPRGIARWLPATALPKTAS